MYIIQLFDMYPNYDPLWVTNWHDVESETLNSIHVSVQPNPVQSDTNTDTCGSSGLYLSPQYISHKWHDAGIGIFNIILLFIT